MAADTIFDVAISFVEQFDRPLAQSLFDELSPRLSGQVFVYWQHQNLLAGKRQEEGFGPIFRSNSRVALVLLRPQWGEKGGTLVEAQEVHRRHLTGDKDFIYFLATSADARLPEWAPPTLVYYDITRYPLTGAIDGIVDMVNRRTAPQTAKASSLARIRLRRQAGDEADRERWFLESTEGREVARQSARAILDGLRAYVAQFNQDNPDIVLTVRPNRMNDQVLVAHGSHVSITSWDDPISHRNRIPELVYTECDGLCQMRYDDAVPVNPGRATVSIVLRPSIENGDVAAWHADLDGAEHGDPLQWKEEGRPTWFTPQEFIEYAVERVLARLAAE